MYHAICKKHSRALAKYLLHVLTHRCSIDIKGWCFYKKKQYVNSVAVYPGRTTYILAGGRGQKERGTFLLALISHNYVVSFAKKGKVY